MRGAGQGRAAMTSTLRMTLASLKSPEAVLEQSANGAESAAQNPPTFQVFYQWNEGQLARGKLTSKYSVFGFQSKY